MNAQFYNSAGYVPPGGTGAEEKRRQGEWDEHQRQQRGHRASMDHIPEYPHVHDLTTRKRADSHQPALSTSPLRRSVDATPARSSYEAADHSKRYYSVEYGSKLSPQMSPFQQQPPSELRRLSGTFNAPTHIELERDREQRKSLKGVERLRSKVRGWVKV